MQSTPVLLPTRSLQYALVWLVCGLLSACAEAPQSNLPPSATDLVLMKSAVFCDRKSGLQQKQGLQIQREAWGEGEELRIVQEYSASGATESYFFNEDGLLVGALFLFRSGLDLTPHPVLRQTLLELKPTVEFYLGGARLPGEGNLDSSGLYMTGDEKTTTQYLIRGERSDPTLLAASFAVDPYATVLSPYRPEFLARLGSSQKTTSGDAESKFPDAKEPAAALQQFARGQTAQLGYCGERNYDVAADAYRKAMAHGFSDKVWVAEAHHRLGLALEGQGRLQDAKAQMEESLTMRPNTPEVLNNLGTVFRKLGDRAGARKVFERAVTLRPNYPIARYNLAEEYESVNAKRAISEYETYLALVEGISEEAARANQAKQRIKALRR